MNYARCMAFQQAPSQSCRAVLFDLDGVLTPTAQLHARAWKATFDAFMKRRATETGEPFTPFDVEADYRAHVDGKRRADGVRAFLGSRAIRVEEGHPDDPPSADTIHGIGAHKNESFRRELEDGGIGPYHDAMTLLGELRAAKIPCAVVSSSANAEAVLNAAGIAQLFEERVDGRTATELSLQGKPAPDTFLEAARRLGVAPADAAVIEDATAGVQAGRAGHFGLVIGLARHGEHAELHAAGADRVLSNLDEAHELLLVARTKESDT